MRRCHHSPPDPECLACNDEEDREIAEREREAEPPADDDEATAALNIAEGDPPWPGWEFGF